jgi:glycine dehydrogenase
MLQFLGFDSLDALVRATVPESILREAPLELPDARTEREVLNELARIAKKNQVFRSFIGQGYYGTFTPPVIQRNILENPGWYTQYTPYQAEIAQGRLEALLNFQTLVADLTGLPLSNASLLDEATAAAEAMTMCRAAAKADRNTFVVAPNVHPQTIAVVETRAKPLGIHVLVSDPARMDLAGVAPFAVLIQYPATDGLVRNPQALIEKAHAAGARVIAATDLLALTLLKPPGELGVDVAVGSSQRFGVPLGFGGPHAAFFATREDLKRLIPGRIVGVSKDAQGNLAYRLALQTREQHIRRERATSNICTAQVLLAVIASMYAVYHGPEGLRRIAQRVRALTLSLAAGLKELGYARFDGEVFDTLRIKLSGSEVVRVHAAALEHGINLRPFGDGSVGISLDETTTEDDLRDIFDVFASARPEVTFLPRVERMLDDVNLSYPEALARTSSYLEHPVFNSYHSEHELLRYMHRLESKDLSLTTSMIPLGSCTMKLNATAEMSALTWREFGGLHPFAPLEQATGYLELAEELERWLAAITGMDGVCLQPNSGAQGEYTGLLVIRAYHESRGDRDRDVCLIPTSAHGTNPASAVLAGFRVVPVACDAEGSIDRADLTKKIADHKARLAAVMITYPSTHGVFEEGVREVCEEVHAAGGLVYLDGANMNAQVGLARPGDYGADVCHLNLHKTFAIPHGGGGPGMGPIAVKAHLTPFLPEHPHVTRGGQAIGPVSAAPYGSASILTISWAYIALMGKLGLRQASAVAILNANYMAKRLEPHYPILFQGKGGRVAHEFVMDARPLKKAAGIEVDDIAKRLMDYGFHAPTMSWPVPGTLMVEPTESESLQELDRFCDAMIQIRSEADAVARGELSPTNNPLKNAPHTAACVVRADWDRPYSREQAAFPSPATREHKYWPSVGRIDNAAGDRNLICTCVSVDEAAAAE